MLCHTIRLPFKTFTQPIEIALFSCVHWGSAECDEGAFETALKDAEKNNRYLIFLGDMFDLIIPKDIRRYREAVIRRPKSVRRDNIHVKAVRNPVSQDALAGSYIREFATRLRPHRERAIGFLRGNHEDAIIKNTNSIDPIYELCDIIGKQKRDNVQPINLGYSSILTIRLYKISDPIKTVRTVTILMHHGFGGGSRTGGGSLTKYVKHAQDYDTDIACYAHDHGNASRFITRFSTAGDTLIKKDRLIVVGGSYQRVVTDGTDPSYGEKSGFNPATIGSYILQIQPDRLGVRYHTYFKPYGGLDQQVGKQASTKAV